MSCKSIRIDLAGPPCPRCNRAMEVREHGRLRKKHLRQPYYYARWYRCNYGDCRTTLVMPPQFLDSPSAPRIALKVTFSTAVLRITSAG
jgi:hypothetical protein